ncbi:MAG TPA: S41 family peptidase [Terriglobia bacterium]|nr:S41 family peptidase [Terriglobia bacterium]
MHTTRERDRILLLAGLLLLVPTLLRPQEAPPNDPATQESLKFAQIYSLVQENYVDSIDPDHAIFDGAIRNMLDTLDPFSAFFDRQQFKQLQEQTSGEAIGFGSILYVKPGKVLVLQAAEGSPSWRAGLGPGDEIMAVNGERVSQLDFQSLIQLLQRSRSHPVTLGILHPGKDQPQEVRLVPKEVEMPTVDSVFEFQDRQIGYVHVSGFDAKTTQEVQDAIAKLGGAKLKGLLFDLRNNHGGVVATAAGVASLFLQPGMPILTMRGRGVPEKSYSTMPMPVRYTMPMVVLINGETASAAELLTAALEEHDRAVVAGENSYGKGVVENVMPLSDDTGLALTVAQYFTPSGRSIQRRLPGTMLAEAESGIGKSKDFRTDDGRPLSAGGGITPDVPIPPRALDPWAVFLDQRGLFTDFASQYITYHTDLKKTFEPGSDVMTEFQSFLSSRRVRTPPEYWANDQDYLKLRIRQEVFSLVFGLESANEVEIRGDPQVQKALGLFPKVPEILKAPLPAGTTHIKRVADKVNRQKSKERAGNSK